MQYKEAILIILTILVSLITNMAIIVLMDDNFNKTSFMLALWISTIIGMLVDRYISII